MDVANERKYWSHNNRFYQKHIQYKAAEKHKKGTGHVELGGIVIK